MGNLPCTLLLWNAMFKIYIIKVRRYFYCLNWSYHSFNVLFCLGFILVVNNTAKLFIICAIRTDIFTFTLWDVFEGQYGSNMKF